MHVRRTMRRAMHCFTASKSVSSGHGRLWSWHLTFVQHSPASRWFSLKVSTSSLSPPYQFLICQHWQHEWSFRLLSTDHILKEVFCKTRFPCVEKKETCFNISKKCRVLGGSKGLHLEWGFSLVLGFSIGGFTLERFAEASSTSTLTLWSAGDAPRVMPGCSPPTCLMLLLWF